MLSKLECFLYGGQFRKLITKRHFAIQEKYDLQKIDIIILMYLSESKDKDTSKDIASLKLFTKSHVSQSLSKLLERGLIRIETDKNDRRISHNLLTESAFKLTEEIKASARQILEDVLHGVTDEEREELNRIAEKISSNLDRELEE